MKKKNGTIWMKILSVVMTLNVLFLGYIFKEVAENRERNYENFTIITKVDKNVAVLEFQIKYIGIVPPEKIGSLEEFADALKRWKEKE